MSERVKRPAAACLACVLGFVVVASLAYRDESFRRLDTRVLLRLSAQREAAPGNVARLIAHLGYEPILGYYQVGSTAFPSGHATAVAAMALAVVLVVPRGWRVVAAAVGACLVAAVGCSVVILHRHYPSDVIGGSLIAAGWFFAVVAGLRQLDESRSDGPGAGRS